LIEMVKSAVIPLVASAMIVAQGSAARAPAVRAAPARMRAR